MRTPVSPATRWTGDWEEEGCVGGGGMGTGVLLNLVFIATEPSFIIINWFNPIY